MKVFSYITFLIYIYIFILDILYIYIYTIIKKKQSLDSEALHKIIETKANMHVCVVSIKKYLAHCKSR